MATDKLGCSVLFVKSCAFIVFIFFSHKLPFLHSSVHHFSPMGHLNLRCCQYTRLIVNEYRVSSEFWSSVGRKTCGIKPFPILLLQFSWFRNRSECEGSDAKKAPNKTSGDDVTKICIAVEV